MDNRKEVLSLILKSEGGLNEDEPAHVGGISYAGITQTTWDAYRVRNSGLPKSVRDLAGQHDLVEAFYVDYFGKYHVWELPEFLQYIFADFVVNAGSAAVKIIQNMAGADVDGLWGSGTSRAVKAWKLHVETSLASDPNIDNELITEFHNYKIAHYERLAQLNPEKYARYLPGWKRRANKVLADLGKYFETEEPTTKAIDEDDVVLTDTGNELDLSAAATEELLAELLRREDTKKS
ncbi:MAG: hypothetical protein OXH00_02730 [Candidatus Poribacteria bacterium]|nr:hypothetical protein [Candidatus Poribacteria bacterium]